MNSFRIHLQKASFVNSLTMQLLNAGTKANLSAVQVVSLFFSAVTIYDSLVTTKIYILRNFASRDGKQNKAYKKKSGKN